MDFPYGETVTVLTADTTLDPYSNENVPDWTKPPATSTPVSGVAVEPRPSGEPLQDARNQVTSGFTLYFPAGTAITAQNRVTVRGTTYGVLGEPAVWKSPFTGWAPGVVVQVERTEG
jgi:hypothetical protein